MVSRHLSWYVKENRHKNPSNRNNALSYINRWYKSIELRIKKFTLAYFHVLNIGTLVVVRAILITQ